MSQPRKIKNEPDKKREEGEAVSKVYLAIFNSEQTGQVERRVKLEECKVESRAKDQ